MNLTRANVLALTLAIMFSTGCAASLRDQYDGAKVDDSQERVVNRPDWVYNMPQKAGRMYYVATCTDALDLEAGIRKTKMYALANWTEQMSVAVSTKTKLKDSFLHDLIQAESAATIRSVNQDKVYWERRATEEGLRYMVWVLWSIPEKAFYETQQRVLSKADAADDQ